jgi:crossover junction endodeoxyribonuclease RuvC
MKILGIDPGLNNMGWGVIRAQGSSLSYLAGGTVKVSPKLPMAERLLGLQKALDEIVKEHMPDSVGIEEVFVNSNARTSLILGQARGVAMLVPAMHGIGVDEYTPSKVKQSVVGTGKASKEQVQHMVKMLLPTAQFKTLDTADALAIAITHAHTMQNQILLKKSA